MVTTLYNPAVEQVLARLYAEEKETDRQLELEQKTAGNEPHDAQFLTSIRNRMFMAIAPEVGRLFYLLVRSHRPTRIVEFGASFGISGIHLAAALRDNRSGHLITTEQNSEKAARATQHFGQAGLADLIELRQGDAFKTLAGVDKIDMLVLDGWKPLYLPLLRQLEPAFSPHCLIVADDTVSHVAQLVPYLDYVRDKANGYVSCEIPLDDGVELSFRSATTLSS